MNESLAAALLVGLLLGGCIGGNDKSPDPGAPGPTTNDPGPADASDSPSSLPNTAGAPRWQVGQSWTWSLQSDVLTTVEVKTVVLAAEGAAYDIGVTDTSPAFRSYAFHLIGFGAVDAGTLAWKAHGLDVQLLRFPLVDGDRFTTDLWSAPGAEVEVTATNVTGPDGSEPGFRSVARYAGSDAVFLEAEYAPARGQFVRVATHFGAEEPFAEATLIAQGSNETGQSFRVTDLERWSARTDDPAGLAPREFTVGADADSILLACFITGPGSYSADVVMESGDGPSCGGSSPDATSLYVSSAGPAAAAGRVVAVAGGSGSITVEVFAIDTG